MGSSYLTGSWGPLQPSHQSLLLSTALSPLPWPWDPTMAGGAGLSHMRPCPVHLISTWCRNTKEGPACTVLTGDGWPSRLSPRSPVNGSQETGSEGPVDLPRALSMLAGNRVWGSGLLSPASTESLPCLLEHEFSSKSTLLGSAITW